MRIAQVLGLCLVIAACASRSAAVANDRYPESVINELMAMARADQAVREGMTAESVKDTAFLRRIRTTDSTHTARLKAVIQQYGWPTAARAGERGPLAAFLIVQHSDDLNFQKASLPQLEADMRLGHVPGQEVALLTDRILKAEGKPQRYGSQVDMKDGVMYLWKIEDEANLDQRRAAMGLPPHADYIRMLEEFYKAKVVRHE